LEKVEIVLVFLTILGNIVLLFDRNKLELLMMNNEEPKLLILFSFCKPVKIVDRFILIRSDLRMFAVGLVSTKAQKRTREGKKEKKRGREKERTTERERERET
jgi:hypothetical protein